MNKVTTINLNGRAYSLEERGFEALRKYLEAAAAKLDGNPDKDEIMADFEQAIADKCDQKLSPGKNVITEREIDDIIAAMGPVDSSGTGADEKANGTAEKTGAAGSSNAGSGPASGPKRLYRLPQNEWIMGVCSGLAAYFNIDVTLMRVIWILLTIFTHGFWIIAYIILAVVMPPAHTDEERSQAYGHPMSPPFNAHDFIEQAKKRYAELHDDLQKKHDEHKAKMAEGKMDASEATASATATASSVKEDVHKWKREFKDEMRAKRQQMKQEWRAQQRQWHESRRADMYAGRYDGRYDDRPYGPGYGISRAIFGFFSVIMSLVVLALGIAWIVVLVSFIKHGTVFGYAIGVGHPFWITIVFLTAAFYVVTIPFRLLLHHAWDSIDRSGGQGGRWRHSGWSEFGRTLVFLAMCALLIWTARELFPQVNIWWNVGIEWVKMKI